MRLSYRTLTYLVMGALMLFSAVYFENINRAARNRPAYGQGAAIGPEYFPNALAVLLFLLSLASLVRAIRTKDREIEVPHLDLILLAIGMTALFIGGWYVLGLFYPLTFLFVSTLLYVYRLRPGKRVVTAATSLLIALIVTGSIYFIFDRVMSLRF